MLPAWSTQAFWRWIVWAVQVLARGASVRRGGPAMAGATVAIAMFGPC
jgi:hypothetical protein